MITLRLSQRITPAPRSHKKTGSGATSYLEPLSPAHGQRSDSQHRKAPNPLLVRGLHIS